MFFHWPIQKGMTPILESQQDVSWPYLSKFKKIPAESRDITYPVSTIFSSQITETKNMHVQYVFHVALTRKTSILNY